MNKFVQFFVIFAALQLNLVNAIYNGTVATPHQFPYAVLVHSPRFFCSGTLISNRHVLTAAHCLMSIPEGGRAVVNVGAHAYYGSQRTDGKTLYSSKFWIHEKFVMPSAVYDIGIIELPEQLVRNKKTQWLKLSTRPDNDLDAEDDEIVLAGWGHTRFDSISSKLRYTKMKLIPLMECKKYQSNYIEAMNENHICTEKYPGMPCSGDSGSAIVSTKTKRVLGVMSYVKDAEDGQDIFYNDCEANVPAVSTRISSYIDWISNKTGINFAYDNNQSKLNTIALNKSDDDTDDDDDENSEE